VSGQSRAIVEALRTDLTTALSDSNVLIELYPLPIEELEVRQDIKKARIAIYELPESTDVFVDAGRANLSTQQYGIDISVVRGYAKNNATRGELILYDYRDKIIDWARDTLDVSSITNAYLYTFRYNSSGALIRNNRFVTRTLFFDGQRDINKQQFTP